MLDCAAGLALYSDVRELQANLTRYRWVYFAAGLGLATTNYAIRFLRWQYYLRELGVPLGAARGGVPTGDSARIFVAGFVMSVTPGKVGEVFKSVLLQSSQGVPLARTAPIVVAERLTDLLALVLLTALASTIFADGLWIAAAGGAFVVGSQPCRPMLGSMNSLVTSVSGVISVTSYSVYSPTRSMSSCTRAVS